MTWATDLTAAAQARRQRLTCDTCGDDGELRTMDGNGWALDQLSCRECFDRKHVDCDFTLFPVAQEAKT